MQGKRTRRRPSEGLVARHSRSCSTLNGGDRCSCSPAIRAQIYTRDGQKIRRTFAGPGAKTAAKQWRADALAARGKGELTTPTRVTMGDVAALWLEGATSEPPTVRRKDGQAYKPSYVRTVRDDLRLHVLPHWSGVRLSEITRADVQAWADGLPSRGLGPSRIGGAVGTLRTMLRYAVRRNLIRANPVTDIDVPTSTGRRERAASPAEAAELLAALPESIRPIYACAFFSGLRRGELRGSHLALKKLITKQSQQRNASGALARFGREPVAP